MGWRDEATPVAPTPAPAAGDSWRNEATPVGGAPLPAPVAPVAREPGLEDFKRELGEGWESATTVKPYDPNVTTQNREALKHTVLGYFDRDPLEIAKDVARASISYSPVGIGATLGQMASRAFVPTGDNLTPEEQGRFRELTGHRWLTRAEIAQLPPHEQQTVLYRQEDLLTTLQREGTDLARGLVELGPQAIQGAANVGTDLVRGEPGRAFGRIAETGAGVLAGSARGARRIVEEGPGGALAEAPIETLLTVGDAAAIVGAASGAAGAARAGALADIPSAAMRGAAELSEAASVVRHAPEAARSLIEVVPEAARPAASRAAQELLPVSWVDDPRLTERMREAERQRGAVERRADIELDEARRSTVRDVGEEGIPVIHRALRASEEATPQRIADLEAQARLVDQDINRLLSGPEYAPARAVLEEAGGELKALTDSPAALRYIEETLASAFRRAEEKQARLADDLRGAREAETKAQEAAARAAQRAEDAASESAGRERRLSLEDIKEWLNQREEQARLAQQADKLRRKAEGKRGRAGELRGEAGAAAQRFAKERAALGNLRKSVDRELTRQTAEMKRRVKEADPLRDPQQRTAFWRNELTDEHLVDFGPQMRAAGILERNRKAAAAARKQSREAIAGAEGLPEGFSMPRQAFRGEPLGLTAAQKAKATERLHPITQLIPGLEKRGTWNPVEAMTRAVGEIAKTPMAERAAVIGRFEEAISDAFGRRFRFNEDLLTEMRVRAPDLEAVQRVLEQMPEELRRDLIRQEKVAGIAERLLPEDEMAFPPREPAEAAREAGFVGKDTDRALGAAVTELRRREVGAKQEAAGRAERAAERATGGAAVLEGQAKVVPKRATRATKQKARMAGRAEEKARVAEQKRARAEREVAARKKKTAKAEIELREFEAWRKEKGVARRGAKELVEEDIKIVEDEALKVSDGGRLMLSVGDLDMLTSAGVLRGKRAGINLAEELAKGRAIYKGNSPQSRQLAAIMNKHGLPLRIHMATMGEMMRKEGLLGLDISTAAMGNYLRALYDPRKRRDQLMLRAEEQLNEVRFDLLQRLDAGDIDGVEAAKILQNAITFHSRVLDAGQARTFTKRHGITGPLNAGALRKAHWKYIKTMEEQIEMGRLGPEKLFEVMKADITQKAALVAEHSLLNDLARRPGDFGIKLFTSLDEVDLAKPLRATTLKMSKEDRLSVERVRVKGVEYWRLPDTKVAGTDVKQWGGLAGKWVPATVVRNLQVLRRANPYSKTWQRVLNIWKENRVVNNLGSHLNVVVGNIVNQVIHSHGLETPRAMSDLAKAYRWTANKGDPFMSALVDGGGFGMSRYQVDVTRVASSYKLHDPITWFARSMADMRKHASFRDFYHTKLGEVTSIRAWDAADWLTSEVFGFGGIMRRMFEAHENASRGAIFKRGIEREAKKKGVAATELLKDKEAVRRAINEAERIQFNYMDLPIMAHRARQSGVIPFIAYPVKATGLFGDWIFTRPLQARTALEGGRRGAAGGGYFTDPEEARRRRDLAPAYRQRFTIPIGGRDLNVRYVTPVELGINGLSLTKPEAGAGTVGALDSRDQGPFQRLGWNPIIPAHLMPIYEVGINRSAHFDRPIWEATDTDLDMVLKLGLFAAESYGGGTFSAFARKVIRPAAFGGKDFRGREKDNAFYVMLHIAGIKLEKPAMDGALFAQKKLDGDLAKAWRRMESDRRKDAPGAHKRYHEARARAILRYHRAIQRKFQ